MQDFIKYIDWSILTNCPINCKDSECRKHLGNCGIYQSEETK